MSEHCLACGKPITPPLFSVSHTIAPGRHLCPDCGRRESLDPVWADGMRVGMQRGEAAAEALRKGRKRKGKS